MFGGGDPRRMSVDTEPLNPLPINSRALVVSDPSALNHVGQSSPFAREGVQNGTDRQIAESIVIQSKKLQDDLQEMGKKIKHYEDNIKYLTHLKNKLEESILELQVVAGKYLTTSSSTRENEDANMHSEEEIIQHILKYENSAAAIILRIKSHLNDQISDHPFTNDVLGIVATLGKVDDANLSRLLSEYLGLETMLAVVCKTYEGVKALEVYDRDGSINTGSGIHALAHTGGRPLDDRFRVICLETLRPYAGELIADDPQRRLDLIKPIVPSGAAPPGFLGFAVNMITIDNSNLYGISSSGYNLRQTLFYYLFSSLQVYKTREEMLNSLPYISNGAISLDGGIVRSPGLFSLGHPRRDIDVKFPSSSASPKLPEGYYEVENRLKEIKWKKDQAIDDLHREQTLLEHARFKYESKKQEFVKFLAESSSHAPQGARVSTPR